MKVLLCVLLALCASCSTVKNLKIPVAKSELVARAFAESLAIGDTNDDGFIDMNEWAALVTTFAAKVIARWGQDEADS